MTPNARLAVVFDDAYFGEFLLLRKGKKQHYLLVKS